MDKVQDNNSFKCNTQSSEPFRIDLFDTLLHKYGPDCARVWPGYHDYQLNPSLSHDDWRTFSVHLRSLKIRRCGMVESTGLQIMASR
jgi:hypothetical protein